jgi:hypothetical protein
MDHGDVRSSDQVHFFFERPFLEHLGILQEKLSGEQPFNKWKRREFMPVKNVILQLLP